MFRTYQISLFLSCCVILISSCSTGSLINVSPSSQPSNYDMATKTPFINRVTPMIISTIIPNQTVKETQAVSKIFSTPTPYILPKFTETPGITNIRIEEQIQQLLTTNGDCNNPCIWGIVPGETNLISVKNMVSGLGLNMVQYETGKYVFGYNYNVSNGFLGISVYLGTTGMIVDGLRFSLNGMQDTNIPRSLWEKYSIPEILRTYGVPSKIGLYTEFPHELNIPKNQRSVDITFFYPNKNVVAVLDIGPQFANDNGNFQVCPQDDPTWTINIWMGNFKDGIPYEYETEGLDLVTNLSNQDFYDLVMKDPNSFCFALSDEKFLNIK
jgi:hypothetical protein